MPKPLVSVKLPNEHDECQGRALPDSTVHRFKYFNIDCVNYSNHRQIASQTEPPFLSFPTDRQFLDSMTAPIATKMALSKCFAPARSILAPMLPAQTREHLNACPKETLPMSYAQPSPVIALMPLETAAVARNPYPAPLPVPAAAGLGSRQRIVEIVMNGRGSTLKDLVGLIGIEGTARLIAAFAGMRIYVPHVPQPEDNLSAVLGLDAARELALTYGGDRIDVPNPTPRRVQIVDLHAHGVSIDGIARELRCTRRRVFQVLAEVRNKPRSRTLPQSR